MQTPNVIRRTVLLVALAVPAVVACKAGSQSSSVKDEVVPDAPTDNATQQAIDTPEELASFLLDLASLGVAIAEGDVVGGIQAYIGAATAAWNHGLALAHAEDNRRLAACLSGIRSLVESTTRSDACQARSFDAAALRTYLRERLAVLNDIGTGRDNPLMAGVTTAYGPAVERICFVNDASIIAGYCRGAPTAEGRRREEASAAEAVVSDGIAICSSRRWYNSQEEALGCCTQRFQDDEVMRPYHARCVEAVRAAFPAD